MWCMSTAKKVLTTIAAVFGVLLIAAGAVAYVYGPTVTAMFTGTAKFMGTDTPCLLYTSPSPRD